VLDATVARYVPRLTQEHIADGVMQRDAALMFADISGYTRLSERLAAQGRVGAEIITTVVNECFSVLIDIVIARGGDVVRFGGDALFVVFTGEERLLRAAVAAAEMQTALASIAAVEVPGGRVRLRMSVGLHDGLLLTYRWTGSWTEVIPFGPAVTEMARCEAEANAGQVRVSDTVAQRLGPSLVKGNLLRQGLARRCGTTMPDIVASIGGRGSGVPAGTMLQFLPPGLRDMPGDPLGAEHRAVALSFVSVKGLDEIVDDHGALDRHMAIFSAVDEAAQRFGVVPLGTDVGPGGFKIIMAAGVPRSNEDIEERIVLAARHVVAASPATAAAGVHSGLVFCGEVGHVQRHTFTVMGDAVNLTARLMAKAHAGHVLASRRLLDAVSGRFAVTWQEPFVVKGKLALQEAAIVGERRIDHVEAAGESVLIGRDELRAQVIATIRAHRSFDVVGPSGIGATRLIDSAITRMKATRVDVLATVADQVEQLGVARRLLATVAAHGNRAVDEPDLSAAKTGDQAVMWLVDALLAHWPTGIVCVVDHTHYCDEASLRVLRSLAVSVGESDSCLVAVGRAAVLGVDDAIELPGLDEGPVRTVAIAASLRALSDAELDAIVERASGNPRFAERLAQMGGLDVALPPSEEALVTARLDRLDRRALAVIREMALLGVDADLELVAAASNRAVSDLVSAVRAAPDVLTLRGTASARFADEQVCSVAAAGLARGRAKHLHRSLAGLMTAEPNPPVMKIAYHAYVGSHDELVADWCLTAARQAFDSGAPVASMTQAERALKARQRLKRPNEQIADAAMMLADAADRAGRSELAARALAVCFESTQSSTARSQLRIRQAAVARRRGLFASSERFASSVVVESDEMQLVLGVERASYLLWRGRFAECITAAQSVVRTARTLARRDLEADLLDLESAARFQSGDDSWLRVGNLAIEAARASGDDQVLGTVLGNHGVNADNSGHWPLAIELYRSSIDLVSGSSGQLPALAQLRTNLSSIHLELGALEEAQSNLSAVRRVAAAGGEGLKLVGTTANALTLRAAARIGGTQVSSSDLLARSAELADLGDVESSLFVAASSLELLNLAARYDECIIRADQLLQSTRRFGATHLLPMVIERHRAVAFFGAGNAQCSRHLLDELLVRAVQQRMLSEEVFLLWAKAQLFGDLTTEESSRLGTAEVQLGVVSALIVIPGLESLKALDAIAAGAGDRFGDVADSGGGELTESAGDHRTMALGGNVSHRGVHEGL
jgi:class 3 adenylate cyclase/tetratricopeptide (TPR) repeat protein